MSRLVIEYVFEGHQRGYNYTSPTAGYDDGTLKTVWRHAMPRGQGWGTYAGARSIKCFPLPYDDIAVSEVAVTDQEDESGRRGIRRAAVDVMSPKVFQLHLQSRIAGYPPDVQHDAEQLVALTRRRFPRLKREMPLILAYPFTDSRGWWVMEAAVLKLAAAPPAAMQSWGRVIPFTTLALDYRGESRLVAMPVDRADDITDVPVVDLR